MGGFCLLLLLFPGHIAVTFAAGPERIIPNPREQQRIQEIVNAFMAKLHMAHKVAVAVVPKNPLMVSVEYPDASTGFLLSVEEDFIGELTREELERPSRTSSGTCRSSPITLPSHRGAGGSDRTGLVPRSTSWCRYEKLWKRQAPRAINPVRRRLPRSLAMVLSA